MDGISLNKISGADDLSGDPVAVPVEGPELGEFDQLGVAIGENHVDGPFSRIQLSGLDPWVRPARQAGGACGLKSRP